MSESEVPIAKHQATYHIFICPGCKNQNFILDCEDFHGMRCWSCGMESVCSDKNGEIDDLTRFEMEQGESAGYGVMGCLDIVDGVASPSPLPGLL